MYHNNHPTSSDLFDYDPISLDDELMQLLSSVSPPNNDVSDVLTTLTDENQGQYTSSHHNHMMTFSNTFHASTPQLPQHNNVVEFNFTSAPAPAPDPAGSKDEVRKKKSKAVEIERKRRQDMASLYQELRSLLPPGQVKRKRRSISDLLQEATNHITNTEVEIKGLNNKKDELLLRMRSSTTVGSLRASSRSTDSNNTSSKEQQNHHHVTVKPCKDGLIEVIVSASALSEDDDHKNNNSQGFRLSKMLRLLGEEGLNVINCVSARTDSKLVHTIQAEVDDGRGIDLNLLQQTLTDHS